MGFYKDLGGFILFLICHIVFILQFFLIYEMEDIIDNKQNLILTIHKIIYYIFLFLTVFTHIKTSIIDPGSITINNNKEIIEFYYFIHEPLIKRALYITEKKTPEVIKKIIMGDNYKPENKEKNKEEKKEEENDENDDNSEKDEFNFEPVTSINDTLKATIEEKYHIKLSRCINCFVIRPINAHHCAVCHKCYIGQDHHCPWVNNCIGLFNKKFFVLFLFYSLITVIYSDILFFYYSLYKNINQFSDSQGLLVLDIFSLIFGLILAIVSFMLLWDQYDTLKNDCTECDFKKGILLEKSSIKQQFQIMFGGLFTYKWLLPFYPGGNSDFFKQMSSFLKLKEGMKNKKQNNDGNKANLKNTDLNNKSKKD